MRIGTLLATIVLGAALAAPVMAHDHGRHGGHERGDRMERIAEHLELTDDQREQIRAGTQAHGPELRALRQEMREQRRALREAMQEEFNEARLREISQRISKLTGESTFLRAQARAHMHSVLTEEQRATLQKMHRGDSKGGRWHRHRRDRS